MKKYTAGQMSAIRTLAFIQFKEGIYLIDVPDPSGEIDILTPWMDETGRYELTNAEALAHWGEEVFADFCEKALAYLDDDTVNDRYSK